MKKIALSLIVITTFAGGCSSGKHSKEGLPIIDLTNNYPEKEIFLTDIADVTYLYLNSDDDDYLYNGRIRCITESTIVVYDGYSNSFLFFSKDGNPKSRFNRWGQGPEDYFNAFNLIYDEVADELFVNGIGESIIQVYSSTGVYKRKITLPQGMAAELIDFDENSLFFYDYNIGNRKALALLRGEDIPADDDHIVPFYRISKTDGGVLDYVELPGTHLLLGTNVDGRWLNLPQRYAVKCSEGVLLCIAGTDTVFLYSGDKLLTPVLYQTPSVVSSNPMQVLNNCIDRGQYQFFQVNTIHERVTTQDIFPIKCYLRNKITGEIVHPKLLLPDYNGKEFVINPARVGDYENGYYFELGLSELKQAYRENKLGGKLKELVATLNEDEDNNVFMLVNFK
jgi:hypothetical protein